ncbi:MAG TPA: phosphate acetyltransferase [Candidatus Desulfovibrio intestinavium]|uniref:Phosphate acetyltransferase n=1 Tax=Candidatus Desulfovibrio intestinavium TaxID=2838534 RepID=A0A9D2HJC2_9BACT|nr:phosphate acetyltransferase [Candidatus Desulfovibrio intestinavium]
MNALYLTATGPLSGKTAAALGIMHMLNLSMRDVAIFRPIINTPQMTDRDPDIQLMMEQFKLRQDYTDTFVYTHEEARKVINRGDHDLVIETIIKQFKKLQAEHEFVFVEGTDFLGKDAVYEFELNAEIASNLGCPVMLVVNGDHPADDLRQSLQNVMDTMEENSLEVIATIINRAHLSQMELDEIRDALSDENHRALVYAIPDDPTIAKATMYDVKKSLGAEVLYGANRLDTMVGSYIIAAMHIDNFLKYVEKDQLIITPGDRTDILLAAICTRMSSAKPDIAGVLLTGGMRPPQPICELIEGWTNSPLPILMTDMLTYQSVMALHEVSGYIEPTDARKINTVLGLFTHHVNTKEISKRLEFSSSSSRMTPMMFEFNLIERAKARKMRIVLAEGEEERILQATDVLLRRDVADIILLGNHDIIHQKARDLSLDISGATVIEPARSPKFDDYANTYYELRKAKGITPETARDVMNDATYFATMMVKKDDADGMVSGAVNTTAHTIRPAFEFIKTKPGFSVVSSVFLMCLKDRVLAFGDCAVNPNPTAQQLAEIAIASAHTARVFGIEPRVAMLSYSTGTSGKGVDVDKVKEATAIAKEMAPDLLLEGPIQYDAAIDPTVAKTKLPDSKVAGRATVFIFPDLNTGNNTYKAVQRAAEAVAIGPVLQGLNKPVNDLSRGCTVPDIVNTVAITAVQAAAEKNK